MSNKKMFLDLINKAKLVDGICPTCEMLTMLVSLTKDFYRCVTCGSDLEQKINGVIKYMPVANISQETKPEA